MSPDARPATTGGLEIDEDPAFQERSWRLQRRLWVALAAVLALGLLGLFGDGPLARTTATGGGVNPPLRLEYQRFGRHRASMDLNIDLPPEADAGPGPVEARLRLGRDYLDAVVIESIEPRPERVEASPGGSVHVFRRRDPRRSCRITFRLRALRRGLVTGHVGLDDAPALRFTQLIYP